MHSGVARRGVILLWALWWGAAASAAGQTAPAADAPALMAEVSAEIQNLATRATTIFVGQIVGVRRDADVVEVTFRVEQPVRGAVDGTVVLREWGGNWAPGQNRYVVGQRVLAFLQSASGAGLSSPVHGAEGLVPVVVQGAKAARLLDIRRVAASVPREPGVALPTEAAGAVSLEAVVGAIGSGRLLRFAHMPLPVRGRVPGGLRPVNVAAGAGSQAGTTGRGSLPTGGSDGRR